MIFFDVSDNKIKAIIEKRGVVLSPGQAKEVEDLWSLKIKDNPKMFRGVSFGLKDIKIVNDGLILTIKKIDYPIIVWARTKNIFFPGAITLATGIYLYDDSYYYFAERSNVTFNIGKIAAIAGGIDYKDILSEDFLEHVKGITCEEAHDEVLLEKKVEPSDLRCLGLVYIEDEKKAVFRFIAKATVINLKSDENNKLVKVRKEKLHQFLINNYDNVLNTDIPFIQKLELERRSCKHRSL